MLGPFFNPRGVAIVGASSDPRKLGYGVVRNLVEYRYGGKIYPVNQTAKEILGHPCHPTIADVPEPLDLCVVVVPAPQVADVVDQCGRRGVKHLIVVSGGFAETGPEGLAREKVLAETARRHGMRMIGPNCIGTIDTHTPVNTTFVVGMPQVGDIGFVSQSGAMCAVVIDWARGAGVGFSRIVSLGNQVDVNETEMLSAFARDPQTRVITAYIEGVSDGSGFMRVAEEAARSKPVLVLKAGHGESGAKAVASHTGALAGSAEAYDAAFRHSGVLRANTMEELFDWARTMAWQPLPKGNRVAVLTNAGGPGILAVDALDAAGLQLAPLTDATREFLRPRLPAAGSLANPVDILAGSGPGTYALALDALLADPTVDAALVVQAPQDWFLPTSLAEVISEVAATHNKPVLASIMGLASVDQALAILHKRRVPNFPFPERAASTLAAMVARRRWLDAPTEAAPEPDGIDRGAATAALKQGDFTAFLSAYGLPVPASATAATKDEAVRAADSLGYPVVLKLLADGITHKSELKGVEVDLADAGAVRKAFDAITRSARAALPDAAIRGVTVQKMYTGAQELIVGVRRDPQFGALLLVGTGGTEVELLRDISTSTTPVTAAQARSMLASTHAGARLKGWRGKPAGDAEAVVDAMVRLARAAVDFPAIDELEINPLFALPAGEGAVAVDVRGSMRPV